MSENQMEQKQNQNQSQGQGFDLNQMDLTDPKVRDMLSAAMGQMAERLTAGFRPAEFTTIGKRRLKIEMPDGVKLSAFLAKPEGEGSWPVILVRNPYMSNSFVLEGILPTFAKYGYAVLLVEVRGSQTSEGEWLPFEHEIEDGKAVLDWIAAQGWCNGSIGCYGASYLGHVQWAVANSHHPALKTIFVQVYGPTPYDTFWRRGMFRQDIWSVWVTQMMGENRRKASPPREQLAECLTYRPQDELGEHFIGQHIDWYSDWNSNSRPTDAYWSGGFWGEFYKTAQEADVPMLLEGGWNDIFLRPEIEAWRRLPEEIRGKSRFLIGPWNHSGVCNGDIDFPNSQDDMFFLRSGLEWFDYMLKGQPYPHRLGTVEAYNIGAGAYEIYEDDLRAETALTLYLAENGRLEKQEGPSGRSGYVYDPEQCPENPWGNLLGDGTDPYYAGTRRIRPVGSRSDELYYLSEELTEDLDIAGAIAAELYVSSDAPATAFSITVSEVFENGDAIFIRNDITDIRFTDEETFEEYQPGSVRRLSLVMTDVTWRLNKGSRVRVDISSSNHPGYHIHPNTTDSWAAQTCSCTAQQAVYFGGGQASRLILPIR